MSWTRSPLMRVLALTAAEFAARRPEASATLVDTLEWCYSYDHR